MFGVTALGCPTQRNASARSWSITISKTFGRTLEVLVFIIYHHDLRADLGKTDTCDMMLSACIDKGWGGLSATRNSKRTAAQERAT